MIAISVGIMMLLFFTISWIISHFGVKPVNGGRPPKDNRVSIMVVVIIGEMFQVWVRVDVVVLLCVMNIENREIVRRV